jgi:hypothetical protein
MALDIRELLRPRLRGDLFAPGDASYDSGMSLFYKFAYQVGFAPWERAAQTHGRMIAALLDREGTTDSGAKGLALDIGCVRGSGR